MMSSIPLEGFFAAEAGTTALQSAVRRQGMGAIRHPGTAILGSVFAARKWKTRRNEHCTRVISNLLSICGNRLVSGPFLAFNICGQNEER